MRGTDDVPLFLADMFVLADQLGSGNGLRGFFSEGSGDTSVDDSPETGLLGESQKFSATLRSATWFHDDVSVLAENYVASHKYSTSANRISPIGGFSGGK